jgi:hypothetical protein
LRREASRPELALEFMDRYGTAPDPAAAPQDSSDIRLAESGKPDQISDTEKKQLEPPRPPVSTSIPSYVAVPATLLGGLALLVKLIAEMVP